MGSASTALRDRSQPVAYEYFEAISRSASGIGSEMPAGETYVDPHVIVLLFLFGFCLLYAALVAIDSLGGRQSTELPLESE